MFKPLVSACFALGLTAPVQAGQPYHESLVECSVLIDLLMGEQSFVPGDNKMLDFYAAASATMRQEALRRSSKSYVTTMAGIKREVWHNRWDAGDWDRRENRAALVDWWTYCFKLAEHLELDL